MSVYCLCFLVGVLWFWVLNPSHVFYWIRNVEDRRVVWLLTIDAPAENTRAHRRAFWGHDGMQNTKHSAQNISNTAHCRVLVVYPLDCRLAGSSSSLLLLRITGEYCTTCCYPGKRSKFRNQSAVLNNAYHFCTIAELKNCKLNRHKLVTIHIFSGSWKYHCCLVPAHFLLKKKPCTH